MKKTLSRALSLVLVLTLLISAVPFAMAAEKPIESVAISGASSVAKGSTITLAAEVTVGTGSEGDTDPATTVEWGTSDPTIATVSDGVVTGVKAGSVTITATSTADTTKKDTHTVEVTVAATGITLDKSTASVAVGGTVSLNATVMPTDATGNISWSSSDNTIAAVSSDGTVTAKDVGEATITASLDGNEATCTVSVTAPTEVTEVTVSGANTVAVGGTVTLTATPNVTTATSSNVVWVATGDAIEVGATTGVVTGKKIGSGTVTATIDGITSDPYTVTVTGAGTVTATLSATSAALTTSGASKEKTLTVSYAGASSSDTVDSSKINVVWSSSASDVASVSNGKVTGLKSGTATIKATLTSDTYSLSGAGSDGKLELTCSVSVSGAYIVEGDWSIEKGTYDYIEPTVSGVAAGTSVTYTYSASSSGLDLTKISNDKCKIEGDVEGHYTVTIKASYTEGGVAKELSKDVNVYVWDSHEIVAVIKSGVTSFTFDEDDVFTSISLDGKKETISSEMSLRDQMISDGWEGVTVRESSSTTGIGKLSKSGVTINTTKYEFETTTLSMSDLKFTLNGNAGTESISYTMTANYDDGTKLTVSKGTIKLSTGGSGGDIIYKTNYSTAVTLEEEDFEKFWDDNTTSGTLKYVMFSVGTNVPKYGELYTTSTKATVVKNTMGFAPDDTTTNDFYDLDKVTYVPSTSYTTHYTVEIPFVCYGGTGTNTSNYSSLSGTLVIDLNDATTTITARGVIFGNADITEMMEEDYLEATGLELEYVTFYLPDADEGRLYYNFSDVLNSTRASATEKYYADASNSEPDLDKICFIPAAGTYGDVTIYYKGYDAYGENGTNGTVTLTITKKTKSAVFSDVTATSYSWASDSVDFLYYEEISQGSNGKYNPKSNITRGDFMLMLYRAFLEDDYDDHNVTSNFSDVSKGTTDYSKETYQAVGVAKYLGIAQGSNGKYNPKASITREEAMTLIYRTLDKLDIELEYETYTSASSFSDYSSISSYAKSPISELVSHGIIQGSNNKINPKAAITRAEMAAILHRVLTY